METCVVCGEAVDERNSAVCQGCNRRYHLVLRQGEQGKDCGDVWINEAFMSLQFACFDCLRRAGANPPPPSVEAASESASAPRPLRAPLRNEQAPPSRARCSRARHRYRKR